MFERNVAVGQYVNVFTEHMEYDVYVILAESSEDLYPYDVDRIQNIVAKIAEDRKIGDKRAEALMRQALIEEFELVDVFIVSRDKKRWKE